MLSDAGLPATGRPACSAGAMLEPLEPSRPGTWPSRALSGRERAAGQVRRSGSGSGPLDQDQAVLQHRAARLALPGRDIDPRSRTVPPSPSHGPRRPRCRPSRVESSRHMPTCQQEAPPNKRARTRVARRGGGDGGRSGPDHPLEGRGGAGACRASGALSKVAGVRVAALRVACGPGAAASSSPGSIAPHPDAEPHGHWAPELGAARRCLARLRAAAPQSPQPRSRILIGGRILGGSWWT